ncbi:hypothetical protein HYQ46_002550 [Verticillium longisporum]|nr:hypothetical protein HYQ46_002550 [Verticillium longisporum]
MKLNGRNSVASHLGQTLETLLEFLHGAEGEGKIALVRLQDNIGDEVVDVAVIVSLVGGPGARIKVTATHGFDVRGAVKDVEKHVREHFAEDRDEAAPCVELAHAAVYVVGVFDKVLGVGKFPINDIQAGFDIINDQKPL